jgi:hypothetical protein
MLESFSDGGWGMYPTLVFGLTLVGVAARYAARPESRTVPLLVSLGILTLTSGALGFVTGFIVSIRAVSRTGGQEPLLSLIGAGEALNNVALALLLGMIASMATVLGAYRLSRRDALAR